MALRSDISERTRPWGQGPSERLIDKKGDAGRDQRTKESARTGGWNGMAGWKRERAKRRSAASSRVCLGRNAIEIRVSNGSDMALSTQRHG